MTVAADDDPTHAITLPVDDPSRRVGTVLDNRYRLLELIGQGGMGAVYRAEHIAIRRAVALKVLEPDLARQAELRRRFEREAVAIGRIDHPNCVAVLDFGELPDGSLYLGMEYLNGRSLAELLAAEGRIAPRRALEIMRHVLRGLGHAHRAGIVHRDMKPENVVVVAHDGVAEFAKVLDFGICRLVDGSGDAELDLKLTQAGVAFGTPIYISPEQAVGEPAGPAADLYSATVVLYELITGSPPFCAKDRMELLGLHVSRPPPPIEVTAPDLAVGSGLSALVNRGLAKKPRDRFAGADEYIAAIDALLEEPAGEARAAPPPVSAAPTPHPIYPVGSIGRRATAAPLPRPLLGRVAAGVARRPWVSAGVATGVVAVVAAVLMSGGETVVLVESPLARRAAESLAGGDPREVIRELGAEGSIVGDAAAHVQLGHAHAARSEYKAALAAYGGALAIDPGTIAEPRLRANLRLMFDDEGGIQIEAARLLAVHAGDADALLRIIELGGHEDVSVRREATKAATALGVAERIDQVIAATHDLRQNRTCQSRREAVARLRALGDVRAVPALRKALARRGKKNGNRCLLQAAQDAIRYLETVAPDADASRDGGPPTEE